MDTYTASVRKPIQCPQCNENTCVKCVERYMLTTIEDPHCPHCRYGWNRAFLNTFCTQTFLNKTYFKYRQDVLMNRERSYLPDAMARIEREKRAREVEKSVRLVYAKQNSLRAEYERELAVLKAKYEKGMRKYGEEIQAIWAQADLIRAGAVDDADGAAAGGAAAGGAAEPAARRKFIRKCTASGCTGFLSSVWKCGICENWVCPDCFEVKGKEKDTEHVCKPDMLESAKLIKKDTKPCPHCGEMIMKVDGCDQMWCVSCHTPFSWSTGLVVKSGAVHNPHYYQWLRNGGSGQVQGQAPGFIPCGGFPETYALRRSLRLIPKEELETIMDIHMRCLHISDIERNRYRAHHGVHNNEDLNVRYLLKEIDEDTWKKTLAQEEKTRQKSREIRDILDAFVGAAIDLMRRVDVRPNDPYERSEGLALTLQIITEMNALREYINGELAKVSKSFNCSVPYINADWSVGHGNIGTVRRVAAGIATQSTSGAGAAGPAAGAAGPAAGGAGAAAVAAPPTTN